MDKKLNNFRSWSNFVNQKKYSQKNLELAENLDVWLPKLLRGIYPMGLKRKDKNLDRKVEVKYMNEHCSSS